MFQGGCLCGAVRIRSTGEVNTKALCHCLDCHKISGSSFSTNIIVASDGFSVVKGTPSEYVKTADSGKTITSFFCNACGATMWRESDTYAGTKIIKAGCLDSGSGLEDAEPTIELFVKNRPSWLPAISGAEQRVGS